MSIDYKRLEEDLVQLLDEMPSFTSSEASEVQQFLAAGEYGVAFETLCGIINEEHKVVPLEVRPKIRAFAEHMKIDPIWWTKIVDGQ